MLSFSGPFPYVFHTPCTRIASISRAPFSMFRTFIKIVSHFSDRPLTVPLKSSYNSVRNRIFPTRSTENQLGTGDFQKSPVPKCDVTFPSLCTRGEIPRKCFLSLLPLLLSHTPAPVPGS